MSTRIMPRGWMNRKEPPIGRPKMWRFIYLTLLYAAVIAIGFVMLWIETDGASPKLRLVWWIALAPGPLFASVALYYRFTEKPGPM